MADLSHVRIIVVDGSDTNIPLALGSQAVKSTLPICCPSCLLQRAVASESQRWAYLHQRVSPTSKTYFARLDDPDARNVFPVRLNQGEEDCEAFRNVGPIVGVPQPCVL